MSRPRRNGQEAKAGAFETEFCLHADVQHVRLSDAKLLSTERRFVGQSLLNGLKIRRICELQNCRNIPLPHAKRLGANEFPRVRKSA